MNSNVMALVRKHLRRQRSWFLRSAEVGRRLGLDTRAVETALSALSNDPEFPLIRLAPGHWCRTVMVDGEKMPPPPMDVALFLWPNAGVGYTGRYAISEWWLTTQMPLRQEFVIVGPVPRSKHLGVGHPYIVWHSRSNELRRGLRSEEINLLEVLRVWPNWVEYPNGWQNLVVEYAMAVADGEVKPRRLARAIIGEPSEVRRLWHLLMAGAATFGRLIPNRPWQLEFHDEASLEPGVVGRITFDQRHRA